jgi:hypothetical protein
MQNGIKKKKRKVGSEVIEGHSAHMLIVSFFCPGKLSDHHRIDKNPSVSYVHRQLCRETLRADFNRPGTGFIARTVCFDV